MRGMGSGINEFKKGLKEGDIEGDDDQPEVIEPSKDSKKDAE
jgi:Sec-independent protein translocase protein TatA